jgi:hypothetical protein
MCTELIAITVTAVTGYALQGEPGQLTATAGLGQSLLETASNGYFVYASPKRA